MKCEKCGHEQSLPPEGGRREGLLEAADIVQRLVRLGEPGEIEETLRRLASSLPQRGE